MQNLKMLILFFLIEISSFSFAHNIYKIGLIHLYSYHSFESKNKRSIIKTSRRKINFKSDRKFNIESVLTDIEVDNKFIFEFDKLIFLNKDLVFITLSNNDEIYKSFLSPGPCYPFGTFLITFQNKKNKILKQIKIDSFENLQKIFSSYIKQFRSEKERQFVENKLIPHLLSGYQNDLSIRNSNN